MTKFYWFLGHEQFQPEELVEQAKLAEEAGFDGVMASEHFHPWVDDAGAGGFAFETLAAIAAVTQRLELMTAVVTPLWRFHPAVVAQAAATLDRLSGGRFALGLGTGENINEGPLGYDFSNYRERAERLREAVAVIRPLLEGKKLDYEGKYYRTKGAKLYSPPLGRVPLYLAAGGPKSAAMAGELADGVVVSVKAVDDTREQVLEPMAAAAREAGRPGPALIVMHWTARGRDKNEVWKALRSRRGMRVSQRLTETDPKVLRRAADAMPREEVLSRYKTVNSAEDYLREYGEVVRELRPAVLGICTAAVDTPGTIETLGREVLPKLRGLAEN